MHVQSPSFVPISAGKAAGPSVAAAVAAAVRLFGGASSTAAGVSPGNEFPDMSLHYPTIFPTVLVAMPQRAANSPKDMSRASIQLAMMRPGGVA